MDTTAGNHDQMNISLRRFLAADMPDVIEIEEHSFRMPWRRKDFLACLRRRPLTNRVVVDEDGTIVGYIMYYTHDDHIEIINFAVHEDYRREGVGCCVIGLLIADLGTTPWSMVDGARKVPTRISFVISEYNVIAQLFLKDSGFRCITTLYGHYEDSREAAYEMVYDTRGLWIPSNRISRYIV